jgi:hypothetical protein
MVDSDPEQQLFRRRVSGEVKYSAFNIAPVISQGSIEFRHHRGEYNPEVLINWVNMVLAMKRYTVSLGEQRMTSGFIDNIVNGSYQEFIDEVFEGVTVPRHVDGWDGAARVAKKVSSRAAGEPNKKPLLPTVGSPARNRFAIAQKKLGRQKISSYKRMYQGLIRGGVTSDELTEETVPDRPLASLYSTWLRVNGIEGEDTPMNQENFLNSMGTQQPFYAEDEMDPRSNMTGYANARVRFPTPTPNLTVDERLSEVRRRESEWQNITQSTIGDF